MNQEAENRGGETRHCCIDVRGVIKRPEPAIIGLFRNADGSRCTKDQVIDTMLEHLAQGHEVVPVGEPCEGFDYKSGCPGHPHAAQRVSDLPGNGYQPLAVERPLKGPPQQP